MKITLRSLQNLEKFFAEQKVINLDFVDVKIGYDEKAYFLFLSRIPPRIDGMFVDTVANAEYTALIVTPSWENGTVENVERIDFGKHTMNFHFIRPVPDGSFLLLGSRCEYRDDGPEKNAVFTDREGNVLRSFSFGDGISDCIVRKDGVIITGYFDEGVFSTRKGDLMRTDRIASFIRENRKAAGLTQKEFAIRSGLGLRFIHDLERGKETVRMDKVNQALAMFGMQAVPGRLEPEDEEV